MAQSTLTLEERIDKEILDKAFRVLFDNPAQPVTNFEGIFHHLNYDWRKHSTDGRLPDVPSLTELLEKLEEHQCKPFCAQIFWAMIEGDVAALMDAAFGKGGEHIGT